MGDIIVLRGVRAFAGEAKLVVRVDGASQGRSVCYSEWVNGLSPVKGLSGGTRGQP